MLVKAGSTDVTTYFHLRLAADGTDATGLTIANIDLQYTRSGATPAAKVDATALAAANTAHTDNFGFEIDATDQPGVYRIDWPDAAFASGVREVILTVKVATAFTESLRVELTGQTDSLPTVDTNNRIVGIQGTITTLDALDTAQDTQHGTTQTAIDSLPTNAELATALGTADDAVLSAVAGVQSDTNDIQTRLPAALTSGGNMKTDVLFVNGTEVGGTGTGGDPWGPA
jgi:hypothetical protein